MAPQIPSPTLRIPIELLTQASFSQFGTVIENPTTTPTPPSSRLPPPPSILANQNTARKYLDVTHMTNLYHLAPSSKPAHAAMNMFVCSPRELRPHEPVASMPSSWGDIEFDDEDDDDGDRNLFDVNILERHPFTTQTFIPMGIGEGEKTQYLVIVAPTLPPSARRRSDKRPPYPTPVRVKKRRSVREIFARARPSPFTNEVAPPQSTYSRLHPSQQPKGPGLPDLKNIRAFVASGKQAVTYGAGTWHAPMVVLGEEAIDFVVVQFVNGVGIEDCQEVELKANERAEEGITVAVDTDAKGRVLVKAGVGAVRAKL